MKKTLSKIKRSVVNHKFITTIVVIIVIVGGYYTYKKVSAASVVPQYIQSAVKKGSITKTVTGSGQVSSENQLDITSEVSGKILSISAAVGQTVKTGDLIATLDSHDAMVDLENSRIAYAKLTEPAKVGDIVNAQNSLTKSYSDSFGTMSDVFLHVPSVMSGLKDMFYGRTGYLSDSQSSSLIDSGKNSRLIAGTNYDKASNDYSIILQDYKNLSKTSTPAEVEKMISRITDFVKEISETLKNTQATVTFITVTQPDYNSTMTAGAAANINTWSGQINSDLSSLLSAKNSIDNNKDSLSKLKEGADDLDIRSSQLSLQQKERTYGKYFIRAPFDGVIGKIPVHVYDQAGSGTVIATLSSNQKVTNIPLNEVDAVRVEKGQKAVLTFDAIEGLKIDGIVSQVDLVGTASQGVVTYNIKISFEGNDDRIRPGMSVDATIVTEEKTGILVVPASAVKTQGRISYVEVAPSSPKAAPSRVNVTVGESDDTNTEILKGLEEGQKIITRTIAGGATPAKSTAPTILNGLGGGAQRNVIRNAR